MEKQEYKKTVLEDSDSEKAIAGATDDKKTIITIIDDKVIAVGGASKDDVPERAPAHDKGIEVPKPVTESFGAPSGISGGASKEAPEYNTPSGAPAHDKGIEVPKPVTECAIHIQTSDTCIPETTLGKVADALHLPEEVKQETKKELYTTIADKLGCDVKEGAESCVYNSEVTKKAIGVQQVEEEKHELLKPVGPKNNPNKWLSNVNIDEVLEQLKKKFENDSEKKFFPYEFAMADLMYHLSPSTKDYDYRPQISTLLFDKLYEQGYRCAGAAINTDLSTGRGKHWTAFFIDAREPDIVTLEFYNSTGQDPGTNPRTYKFVEEYFTYLSKKLQNYFKGKKQIEVVYVTRQDSQGDENASCGVYTIFYIYQRVHGIPYSSFMETKINPNKMREVFRKYCFRENA